MRSLEIRTLTLLHNMKLLNTSLNLQKLEITNIWFRIRVFIFEFKVLGSKVFIKVLNQNIGIQIRV
jgi:hypothetical protein